MEQQHRVRRYLANLGVGLAMASLGAVSGYMVKHNELEGSIKNASPAIIRPVESPRLHVANILFV